MELSCSSCQCFAVLDRRYCHVSASLSRPSLSLEVPLSTRYVDACERDRSTRLKQSEFGVATQEGKFGEDMYFVISGMLEVLVNGERLGFLAEGAFFGNTPTLGIILVHT